MLAHAPSHVVLHGRVQGVGFRCFVARGARELGLRGEVRNRADGAVEVVAEGDAAALERSLERAARRARRARGWSTSRSMRSEGTARYRGFAITG